MNSTFSRLNICAFFAFLLFVLLCPIAFAGDTKKFTDEELNEMELSADKARELFWKGEYQEAAIIFKDLSSHDNPSKILYLNELGSTYIARDDHKNAEVCFREVAMLLDTYFDKSLEEKALSKFGKEEEKIYHGDPYEQATSLLLLSLLFIDEGDYDNALAAIKTAALADSDATENMYNSDLTLLHLLEAKIHLLRGDNDNFYTSRNIASESYRITHQKVRGIFSERLDLIALLKLSPREREKLDVPDTDETIKEKIADVDNKLKAASESIDVTRELGLMHTGDFNTLILVPSGDIPYKSLKGKDAQLVIFDDEDITTRPVKISIDDTLLNDIPKKNLADLEFQATTRGGRRMDAILQGQAAYRDTTVGVGNALTQAGNNAGGYVGLGVAIIGVIVQGVGGAISPEADTRCWETLPEEYLVYALKLPEGEHTITVEQFLYFEKRNIVQRRIHISGHDDVAVVFGPPPLVGLYAPHCEKSIKLSKNDVKDRDSEERSVIITPPLGLERIERFLCSHDDEQPEAFAPDARRIMRKIQKSLKEKNIRSYLVNHEDIMEEKDYISIKSQVAFQLILKKLETEKVDKQRIYRTTFDMALINIVTGEKIYCKTETGMYTVADSKPTEGFYSSLEDALAKFISTAEFSAAINDDINMTASKNEI